MQEWIVSTMNQFGYFGIFFLIAIENIFPPIPSELILPLAGFMTTQAGSNLTLVGSILVATIGSLLGAAVLYYIGTLISVEKLQDWLSKKTIRRLGFKEKEVMKTVDFFNKYGVWAVSFGRCVPIIRSLISIPAGMTKMNLLQFSVYTAIGSLIWNIVLIYLGAILGANWSRVAEFVDQYSKIVLIILVIIFIIGVAWFVIRRRKQKTTWQKLFKK